MKQHKRVLLWILVVMALMSNMGAPSAWAETSRSGNKDLASALLSASVADKLLMPLLHPEGRCASDVRTADFYYEDKETYTDSFPGFIDVSSHASYCNPLRVLISLGAINGYSDDTFRPYNPVTRSQFSKMIVKAFGYSLISPQNATYADVPVDSPFFTFVETANAVNLVTGNQGDPNFWNTCIPLPGGGHGAYENAGLRYFRPCLNMTRGQMAKPLSQAAQFTNIVPSGRVSFSDVSSS